MNLKIVISSIVLAFFIHVGAVSLLEDTIYNLDHNTLIIGLSTAPLVNWIISWAPGLGLIPQIVIDLYK
jgi:hypothetical protein